MKKIYNYFFLTISICLHAAILIRLPSNSALTLNARKGKITIINFTLSNNRLLIPPDEFKKNLTQKEIKKHIIMKGTIPSLKQRGKEQLQIKKKKSISALGSISKYEIKKIEETYQKTIREQIERMKYYPIFARRTRLKGKVKIQFTLLCNGLLKDNAIIIKECNHDILNRAGVNTIHKASPFPSFPKGIMANEKTFFVDIVYDQDLLSKLTNY